MPVLHRAWTPALLVVVASAAAVLSTSMGLRQSLGLFLEPMARSASASTAAFGLAIAVQNLAWGVGQPFMGGIADRYGSRAVVIVAALAYAAGLASMAFGGEFGLYFGGGLLIGLAVAGTSFGVLVGVVSRAAPSVIRSTAVSVVAAAGSIGAFILAPGAQAMIEAWGWQNTLMVFAAIALSIGFLALGLDRGPVQTSSSSAADRPNPLGAAREALSHPGYVAMTVAFFACGFQLIFIATHLPNYITMCGLPPSVSAQALALIGLCNAVGTLVIGKLGERFGNRLILALIYVMRTAAIAVYFMWPVSVESTLLFAAVMGFLWLSVIPPVSALISGLFGPANFGTLFGVMFLSHQIGSFLGAWLGGLTYDLSGSYSIAWSLLIAIGAIAALVQLLMDDRPRTKAGGPSMAQA